ncbi:hypothetical protein [Streptomyces sp. RerS4]|uniref:hypothetical protein n=1 Tax=Streptomyces sp. RerS4 TaxID=2942449 RepID=UPI00201C1D92|nr:hypothetical protein [Streptomyces sp. RerS4]UQX03561.1 hypothetical protein M4D82_26010 [Streptomyces sp. RerS4]
MSGKGTRTLVARTRATGLRTDTGPPPTALPDTGSHFVVLLKPEVMTPAAAPDMAAEAIRVLGAQEVAVRRAAVVPAGEFAGRGYLLLHYPRLHRVAADGHRALTSAALRELRALAEASGADEVLGAYEAMTRGARLTPRALDARCRAAGIHKLGSGSYASVTELNGRLVTVLNGFLPALVEGYTSGVGALVGLLECHSRREIGALRAEALGALCPADAAPGSLRAALGALARERGIALSQGRNAVHLSAGHLEGMFQAWRYFAATDGRGVESTGFGATLVGRGVPPAALAELAADHNLAEDSGETLSPHGATEGLGRAEALGRVENWIAGGKGPVTT